ncbi:hypothetical protein BKA56DRAFT_578946 [Ilyonectria sp. MPI-CAGE-AT-0026]|nr:hypothetical protein BKA56DRAFT_578946 [Ilyonectria sp. MPI-CAGE-AT-0026]
MRLLDLFGRVRLGACRLGDVPQQKSTGRVADQNVMDGMGGQANRQATAAALGRPHAQLLLLALLGLSRGPPGHHSVGSPSRGGLGWSASCRYITPRSSRTAALTLYPAPSCPPACLPGCGKGSEGTPRVTARLLDCSRGCEIWIDERDMASGNGSWPVTVSDMEHDRRKWTVGSGQSGGHGSSTGTSHGKALTCAGRRHSRTMTDGR